MLRIVDGELRVKLTDREATEGLVPIILKRYERVLQDKALAMYEIERLKTAKPYVFRFSEN